jgi:uncharacterized iron-regulated protein
MSSRRFERSRLWLVCCLIVGVVGCAAPARLVSPSELALPLGRAHALTGRIWSRVEHAFVSPQALFEELARAQFVLLGETHDNADHHRLQAKLLDRWLTVHPQAAVAFEMLDQAQAAGLSAPAPQSADELRQRVQWDEHGWPAFDLYRPVFDAALHHRARLLAAHPERERFLSGMRGEATSAEASLHLAPTLPPTVREAMVDEIREAHCGHAPEAMIEPMLRAQSFRDAWMARTLVSAGSPVALVAGRGHVRDDRAVPVYLARHGAHAVLTIAFLDVDDAREQATDYETYAFDFVVFTPRVSNESACDLFKQQLERMGHKPTAP